MDVGKIFLSCADRNADQKIVLDALENNVVDIHTKHLNYDLLQLACSNGRMEILRDLIRRGIDINQKSKVIDYK